MSGNLLDEYPSGATIYALFASYGSSGQSITLTGLAVTDVEIYKNGSVTQRSSDAGITLLDTDGIDFDALTGIHGISIDLADNTDAGFYAVGSQYTVVVSAVTIDAQTVSFILGSFRLMAAEGIAGKPKVDVDGFGGTAGTFASGRPEVNTTHAAGTAWASGAITAAAIAADAITAAKVAADVLAEIADAVWDEARAGHVAAGSFGEGVASVQGNVTGSAASVTGAVGSVTGAVGSVTGAVGSVTGNVGGNVVGSVASVTAGVTLAASAVQAIWDALTSALTTVGSIGKLLVDNINATISSRAAATDLATVAGYLDTEIAAILADTNELQADWVDGGRLDLILDARASQASVDAVDNFVDTEVAAIITTLGTPAGASMSADIAAVKAETASIQTDTNDIQTRLPAALTAGGNMKSDALAISGSTESADRLERSTLAIVTGTCAALGTTTSVIASALSPTSAVNDQFKGRIITFDKDTTTTALRGQATDITAYTHATLTFTCSALTTVPAAGDTFTIT